MEPMPRGSTLEQLENAAFTLEPGTVSEPIVTRYGTYILKVEDRLDAGYYPYEQVQAQIRDEFLAERPELARQRYREFIEELKERHHLVLNEKALVK